MVTTLPRSETPAALLARHELAQRLSAARLKAALSVEDVAWVAEIPPSRLAGYEAGLAVPHPRTLQRLCRALRLVPDPLLRLRLTTAVRSSGVRSS